MKQLLSIIEMGGYADYAPACRQAGYRVERQHSMRKAQAWLKRNHPDWVISEFHFDPELRDRTSHLESLLATLQRYSPESRVLVLLEKVDRERFARLEERFSVDATLEFPFETEALVDTLEGAESCSTT